MASAFFYVSVGSQSNVPENLPKKTPTEIKDWESAHGFGTDLGPGRETVRMCVCFELGGDTKGRTFASGIRNCVGLTIAAVDEQALVRGQRARQPGR